MLMRDLWGRPWPGLKMLFKPAVRVWDDQCWPFLPSAPCWPSQPSEPFFLASFGKLKTSPFSRRAMLWSRR